MKNYAQVLETVDIALTKGEYNFCIEFLSPIVELYPLSTKEGVNLRTILITAFCGVNRKDDAKRFCKELLKSNDYKTRENAKYLMEIIDSPEIKKPENWNIKIENNSYIKKKSLQSIHTTKITKEEKKFINLIDAPTGETKPFQKGFTFFITLILLSLILLLSGCVKIENILDLSEIESINNNFKIESKYIDKFEWQSKFEEKIKSIFPDAEIKTEESSFSLKNTNLNLDSAEEILYKIQNTAGELAGGSTKLKINTSEKNFIFLKKYSYKIDLNLLTLSNIDNLEINFKIINPTKATVENINNPQLEISNNLIIWNLIPGEINRLEFSFWSWNKLLIGITLISFLIGIAYFIRFYRFRIGSDLPQLPSN